MSKRKWTVLRFRKKAPEHNIHAAVTHWVRANGGRCLITGPIQVQDWHDGVGKFRVALCCLGRPPRRKGKEHRNG